MMRMKPAAASLAVAMILAAACAQADVVTPVGPNDPLLQALSFTATGAGTQSPSTITGNPANTSGPVKVSDLTSNPASNYSFIDSFGAANGSFAAGTIQGQQFNFVDTYVVDVPTATASAFVFSLNLNQELGIQNLTARIFAYSAGGFQNLTIGSVGAVNGPVGGWSTDVNGVIASTQIMSMTIPAGEYVLQIAGLETGTQSGMYNGSLAIAPVPLPAALPLLLSGLSTLGFFARRRRR